MNDILITAPLPDFLKQPLLANYACHDYHGAADKAGLLAAVGTKITGLVQGGGSLAPVELLDRLPNLKIISVFGVGYDGVPVDYCRPFDGVNSTFALPSSPVTTLCDPAGISFTDDVHLRLPCSSFSCTLYHCPSTNVTATAWFRLGFDSQSSTTRSKSSPTRAPNPNRPPAGAVSPEMAQDLGELTGTVAERVRTVLDRQINPALASHGGRAELVSVTNDGVVSLRLSGGCQGCGMADQTLRNGIEVALRDNIPEITEIHDVIDHAAGENPYVTH